MISATYSNFQQVSRVIAYTRVIDTVTRFMCTRSIRSTRSKVRRDDGASSDSRDPAFFGETTSLPNDIIKIVNKSDVKVETSTSIVNDEMFVQDDGDEDEIEQELKRPLDVCTEDISHIRNVNTVSYNIAKYANKSHVIQELIKLGVKVYKLDRTTDLAEFYITRDFDKDVKPYIQFLHDMGIQAELIGQVLSKNLPLIKVDIDDLQNRVNYMKSHKFTDKMIATMTVRCPQWLCTRIEMMDANLGYIQNVLKVNGEEIRIITVTNPAILISSPFELSKVIITVMKEMEFSCEDTKRIVVSEPTIFTRDRRKLIETFDYLHDEMKLSHETIAQKPLLLSFRKERIYNRYEFLKALNRAQFNPKKPLYVCPLTFVKLSDQEFCNTVCKCSTEIYYHFVKLL